MSSRGETEAYRLLTEQHTLVVVDTETCLADDGGGNRVISIGVVPVVGGAITGPHRAWLIKPREAVDADSFEVHHITDEMLRHRWTFRRLAGRIEKALRGDGVVRPGTSVVFVAQWAAYDAAALRGEFTRAKLTMPDLPILDTMRLAAQLDVGLGRQPSLERLAKLYGIPRRAEHDALDDARVTAQVVVELLRVAASRGHVDLDDVLRQHGAGRTSTASAGGRNKPRGEPEPVLDDAHLATHAELLPDTPTDAELDAWVAAAVACAQLRCPHLVEKAELASAQAQRLLPALTDRLVDVHAPGQAAALVAALAVFVPDAFPTRDLVLPWWDSVRTAVAAAPRCEPSACCPACRNGDPCALDVAHQSVARGYLGEPITASTLNMFVGSGDDRGLDRWVRKGRRRLAGYGAWYVSDYLTQDSNASRASAVLDRAVGYGLHNDEPRLALDYATRLALQRRVDEAATVAAVALTARNTDPGFDLLDTWLHGPYEELRRRTLPRPERPPAKLRTARPAGRERPNRYKW